MIFKFGTNEYEMVNVEINKISLEYIEIESLTKFRNEFYYNCTVSKLLRYIEEKEGREFQERMHIAP